MRFIDLTDKIFGELTVISRADDGVRKSGQKYRRWNCLCSCGNNVICDGGELKKGKLTNCGCKRKENMSKAQRKYNTYEFHEDYVVCFDSNNNSFIIDLEDYDKVKNYYFRVMKNGYVNSQQVGLLHRYVMNCPNDKVIDHLNDTTDNRKQYLKIVSQSENLYRQKIGSNNTSGVVGVHFCNTTNKWIVRMTRKYIGKYDTFEEAVYKRLSLEKEKYGGNSPQKHLFDKYKI